MYHFQSENRDIQSAWCTCCTDIRMWHMSVRVMGFLVLMHVYIDLVRIQYASASNGEALQHAWERKDLWWGLTSRDSSLSLWLFLSSSMFFGRHNPSFPMANAHNVEARVGVGVIPGSGAVQLPDVPGRHWKLFSTASFACFHSIGAGDCSDTF